MYSLHSVEKNNRFTSPIGEEPSLEPIRSVLDRLMQKTGYTQSQIASMSDVTKNTVSKWMTHKPCDITYQERVRKIDEFLSSPSTPQLNQAEFGAALRLYRLRKEQPKISCPISIKYTGAAIRNLRQETTPCLSTGALAQMLHVSKSHISRWEHGRLPIYARHDRRIQRVEQEIIKLKEMHGKAYLIELFRLHVPHIQWK